MLEWLKSLISGPQDEQVDAGQTDNPQVAAAALLVENALADGIYAHIEEERILLVLKETFHIDNETASQILTEAEELAENSTGAYQYTKLIKGLDMEVRLRFIEGLYYVALADGEKCPMEDAFVRHVASLLYVEDVPRAEARQRAEARSTAA